MHISSTSTFRRDLLHLKEKRFA